MVKFFSQEQNHGISNTTDKDKTTPNTLNQTYHSITNLNIINTILIHSTEQSLSDFFYLSRPRWTKLLDNNVI